MFQSRSYSFWLLVVLIWKFLVKICSWLKLRWYENNSDGYFISFNKMWRCLPHINDNITVVVRVIVIASHSWSKLGGNVMTSQRQSSTRDSCQFLLIEFLRQVKMCIFKGQKFHYNEWILMWFFALSFICFNFENTRI